MARATTRPHLSLDRWALVLGVDPLHFNQVTTTVRPSTVCGRVWKQWDWQDSAQLGRESVAQAIQQAEEMIEGHVQYSLLPAWQVQERQQTTRPRIPELFNLTNRDIRGFNQKVQLRLGHYISGGIEAKLVISEGAAIVYIDEDGDGFFETATVTVATTVTDPDEIACYYPGEAADDEWEIRPLNDPLDQRRSVVISAGTAVIRMARWQLVRPELMEGLSPTNVDGAVDANFLTTVDVYRHFNDPQQQVQLLWPPLPNNCNCGDTTCPVCAFSTQFGCTLGFDPRLGIVSYRPATWDATTEAFLNADLAVGRQPQQVNLWYYAGLEDKRRIAPRLEMDRDFERAVAYLSLTLLERPMCGCDNIEALVAKWTGDFALNLSSANSAQSYQIGRRILDNPFGTTRGAVQAWQLVNRDGVAIGHSPAL